LLRSLAPAKPNRTPRPRTLNQMRVLCLFLLTASALFAQKPITIEYLAHAAFLIHSPQGAAAAIDPYNSNRWLGYSFPTDLQADAVLVTHPHYDHDADYQFPASNPRFRLPGAYSVEDLRIQGVEGKHALHYGKEFGQLNTVWLIETGGLRILHVGDNGPLSKAALQEIGNVDVLLAPMDDLEHILTFAQLDEMAEQLQAKVVVPMHYRLTELSKRPASVGPIDRWLKTQSTVRRLKSNRLALAPSDLPGTREVWVLPSSPKVRPWDPKLEQAWRLRDEARKADPADRLRLLREVRRTAPSVMTFSVELAEALLAANRRAEAVRVLEQALLQIPNADHEYQEKAHWMLVEIYEEQARPRQAEAHRQWLTPHTFRQAWQ